MKASVNYWKAYYLRIRQQVYDLPNAYRRNQLTLAESQSHSRAVSTDEAHLSRCEGVASAPSSSVLSLCHRISTPVRASQPRRLAGL